MDLKLVENIADAVLYEGYMLYPYRASSVKNRQRFNWGALAPRSYSEAQNGTEAWQMQTECLAQGSGDATLNIKVRFLHLSSREIGKLNAPAPELPEDLTGQMQLVESLEVQGKLLQAWQEAVERDVILPAKTLKELGSFELPFSFPAASGREEVRDENDLIAAVIIRTQRAINGVIQVQVKNLREISGAQKLFKLTVQIRNETHFETGEATSRDDALLGSLVSTHTILSIAGGGFVSLLDPPGEFKDAAATCQSIGTYPVLAGVEDSHDCMLSSPIILYDYPQIAAESSGNLFDGTEIDEILTLRIMTLTDEEKREMRSIDDRARMILERTEMMPEEQLLKMHGVIRGLDKVKKAGHG
jgi:hydrogenase maturation protease